MSRGLLRLSQGVDAAVEWIARAVLVLTGTALFLLLLLVVALRYAFSESLPWATELPLVVFPVFVIAGVTLAALRGHHIAVEFLLRALPRTGQRFLLILVNALIAFTYAVVANAVLVIWPIVSGDRTPIIGIPASVIYGALLTGFVLLILAALTAILRLMLDPGALRLPQEGPAA